MGFSTSIYKKVLSGFPIGICEKSRGCRLGLVGLHQLMRETARLQGWIFQEQSEGNVLDNNFKLVTRADISA